VEEGFSPPTRSIITLAIACKETRAHTPALDEREEYGERSAHTRLLQRLQESMPAAAALSGIVRNGRPTPRLADARLRHERRSEPRVRELTV
jgi:hypothetical protein